MTYLDAMDRAIAALESYAHEGHEKSAAAASKIAVLQRRFIQDAARRNIRKTAMQRVYNKGAPDA